MGLTIGLTQLNRKKKKDGRIPIYIRFTENRKSRYRSTGIAVKPKYWNANKKVVSSSHRREKHLNIQLEQQLNEVSKVKRELYKRDSLSMEAILNELSPNTDTRSIVKQAKQYRTQLNLESKYWQHRHFGVIINNLTAFIDATGPGDRLDKLDTGWIEGFQAFLLNDIGNINNTVRKKIQRLKRFIKWLLKNGEIENDPFINFEIVSREKTNTKVKLTFQQIQAIQDLDLKPGSNLWHTRNYFLYSFYNAGIRFGDVCTLKWNNIIDGRLKYKMSKTGNDKNIKQQEPMLEILGYYRDDSAGYIFPILDKPYSNPNELRKKISSKNVIVNRRLKKIGKLAGIQASLSFHVSRHSFAQYALKKGMNLYTISKALAHSDLKITEEYLKSFDEELLDNSMDKLF